MPIIHRSAVRSAIIFGRDPEALTSGLTPKKSYFAVMMVQMDFDQSGRYRRALRELVYGALIR
jgi:hypothetical protein